MVAYSTTMFRIGGFLAILTWLLETIWLGLLVANMRSKGQIWLCAERHGKRAVAVCVIRETCMRTLTCLFTCVKWATRLFLPKSSELASFFAKPQRAGDSLLHIYYLAQKPMLFTDAGEGWLCILSLFLPLSCTPFYTYCIWAMMNV